MPRAGRREPAIDTREDPRRIETLLFVCTGNICRSPMAAAIATSLLDQRRAPVAVSSAGLLAPDQPTTREAEAVMRRRRLDLSGHRSRPLEAALQPTPDLIVAMAREHARAVVELDPELFVRTFTLKDLLRRAEEEGRRRDHESLDAYLRRLAQGRKPWDLAGRRPDDDVADPIGRPRRVYERCAAEIEVLVEGLVNMAWPPTPR